MVILDIRSRKGGAGHWIELLLGAAVVSASDQRRCNLRMHGLGRTCEQTSNFCPFFYPRKTITRPFTHSGISTLGILQFIIVDYQNKCWRQILEINHKFYCNFC